MPPRVAILGASGIGQVHARIFHELGAEVCAVLGSSEDTAAGAAAELKRSLAIEAKPFFELERLLSEPIDAISICTPPRMHFAQILAAFEHGLPVFCEKPLLWEDGATLSELLGKLAVLENHPNRRLSVNTSNAVFIDAVRARLPQAVEIERFSFRFHTNGGYRGREIAVDLMPHGLSLLTRLLGRQSLSLFNSNSKETRYQCSFRYGLCDVEFDFQQGHGGPPDLTFRVNGREFRRIQQGRGRTYQVQLQDVMAGESIQLEDPFRTYISAFLLQCRGVLAYQADESSAAVENLRLMAQILMPQVGAMENQ